jgi:HAD superfamily (subfamily IA) hydrolase, TIGR02254
MKYNSLFFDLDNTLLDFSKSEEIALTLLFEHYQCAEHENIREFYNIENRKLWDKHENGEVSFEYLLENRFPRTLAHYEVEIDGKEWDKKYHSLLREHPFLMEDDVPNVIDTLSKSYRLFIATNGVEETQIERLKKMKLLTFFEKVYTSQSIGYQKPDIRFFKYIEEHTPNFDATKALMIGDSVKTDIRGGNNAGMDTCLLSPNGVKKSETKSTYEIKTISELYTILN